MDLNILMASLSAQLLIYGTAWLVMGLGFRLKRSVALLWAAGWYCGALCTALLYFSPVQRPISPELAINLLAICIFLLLQQGVDDFTGYPARRWVFVLLLLGLLLIEVLRSYGDATLPWRASIFTAVACWPLVGIVWRIAHWSKTHTKASNTVILLMVAPVVLTVGLFVLRALLIWQGAEAGSVAFDQGTDFDLLATLLFLVVLGAFNFSLASLVLGAMVEQLRKLSEADQLTGLFNRRVMMRRLEEEHARYLRSGQVYAVVMLDVDHFKRVNDTYGHGVGDQVLQDLATVLRVGQRRTDTLARIGGEEFLLLMPATDTEGALSQARRICERVASVEIATDAGKLKITLSLGLAQASPKDHAADAVVKRADAALYQAKAGGRNQVHAAPVH
jgi:diguanylate cyclase (GGDEF)-like protein